MSGDLIQGSPNKLEAVRAKVIEAKFSSKDEEYNTAVIKIFNKERGKLRLSDVLVAILAADLANRTNVLVEAGGFISKRVWNGKEHKFVAGAEWNLRADSLDDQSQECIDFLYSVLCI